MLFKNIKGKVTFAEPLKYHTSWRIGGPADVLVEPADLEDLLQVVKLSKQAGLPLFILGSGTNILVADEGIKGVVVKLGRCFKGKRTEGNRIIAGGGVSMVSLARLAAENSLGGLEFAIGIPGTLGGAIITNAGAHNFSVGKLVESLRLVLPGGEICEKGSEELKFSYRSGCFQGDHKSIIIDAVLICQPRDSVAIKCDMDNYLSKRKKSQPLGYPNAGSVFKNPPGDSAGRLIEACGCKGMKRGGAEVSLKHANFIVNTDKATAADVVYLIEQLKEQVYHTFAIELETEIEMWGG